MAFKTFKLDSQREVTVYKRRATKNLRLSITADGRIKVTIPTWAPYQTGLRFAKSRQAWIEANHKDNPPLKPGQLIGKAHRLSFIPKSSITKPTSRLSGNLVNISYPSDLNFDDVTVQTVAELAAVKALRAQAETLLPQRLKVLSEAKDLPYNSVKVKHLVSRWGSCDSHKNIVLNLYLMQLPWSLIDYVLLHELAHTVVLKHGQEFWQTMEKLLPDTKKLRKEIKSHKPKVNSIN